MRYLTRRSLFEYASFAAAGSLLTACGQSVTPPGQQAGVPGGAAQPQSTAAGGAGSASSGSVTVWTWTSVENLPAWNSAADGFRQHLVFLFGGRLWDDDTYPTRCVVDSPEAIDGLQFIQDLTYKHHVAPGRGDSIGLGDPAGIGPTDDVFKTGKVGFVYGRYKHATGIFKPITDFEWSMTTLPKHAAQPRRTDMGINAFGIINKSRNQDASWQWIKWMTADEGNARLLGNTSLPANKNVDAYKVSPLAKWQTDLTLNGLNQAWLSAPHPNVRPEMIDALNAELDKLWLDKDSGAEIGKSAAQAVNDVYQKLGPAVPK